MSKALRLFLKNLSTIFKKSLSVSENPFVEKIPSRPTQSPVLGKTRTAVAYRKKMFRPFRLRVSVIVYNNLLYSILATDTSAVGYRSWRVMLHRRPATGVSVVNNLVY